MDSIEGDLMVYPPMVNVVSRVKDHIFSVHRLPIGEICISGILINSFEVVACA